MSFTVRLCALLSVLLAAKVSHADKSQDEARELCARLTLDEKIALIHGVDGDYVGNVPAIPRLGIPAINMNDGPQGFRGMNGTSTAWPCALSMAATWDHQMVYHWGKAMAIEFLGKGSNVLLGPGVNVVRVPRNGRNFEYLSGEDPALGSKLVQAEIKGIQDEGVIANVKHFVHNSQETSRMSVNEVVDERTHWELYMPPFEAAVQAGVLSFMCSYNKINGVYACENQSTLAVDLKKTLGFKGFVVSDWRATHSTVNSAKAGLDMEMPKEMFFGDKLKNAVLSHQLKEEIIDDKVERVIYALIASGSMTRPTTGSFDDVVTSNAHNQLSRNFAAAGVVLLKNRNDILPLQREQTVAVFGDIIACGGGSGHVDPPYVISGFDGIKIKCGQDRAFYSSMKNPDYSKIHAVDVVVVFTSTSSAEGRDRSDLSFPLEELRVIETLTSSVPAKLVVVGTAPGAVLLPFADHVAALLLSFMPGQEGGNAIADILFGDVNPSGKLPVTLPNIENEVGFTPDQYPGVNLNVTYSEKLLTGYRWYDAHQVKPKFAFGFGLSYTQFAYSDLTAVSHGSFTFSLSNVGMYDGFEVFQVYVTFPVGAEEPPKILKYFDKVLIKSGESAVISFSLSRRDYSVWDTHSHSWRTVDGYSTVISVGPSSDNLPLQAQLFSTTMPFNRSTSRDWYTVAQT